MRSSWLWLFGVIKRCFLVKRENKNKPAPSSWGKNSTQANMRTFRPLSSLRFPTAVCDVIHLDVYGPRPSSQVSAEHGPYVYEIVRMRACVLWLCVLCIIFRTFGVAQNMRYGASLHTFGARTENQECGRVGNGIGIFFWNSFPKALKFREIG